MAKQPIGLPPRPLRGRMSFPLDRLTDLVKQCLDAGVPMPLGPQVVPVHGLEDEHDANEDEQASDIGR